MRPAFAGTTAESQRVARMERSEIREKPAAWQGCSRISLTLHEGYRAMRATSGRWRLIVERGEASILELRMDADPAMRQSARPARGRVPDVARSSSPRSVRYRPSDGACPDGGRHGCRACGRGRAGGGARLIAMRDARSRQGARADGGLPCPLAGQAQSQFLLPHAA